MRIKNNLFSPGSFQRQLMPMNPSYPFSPYQFYTSPDDTSEIPYNVVNYNGNLPHISDTNSKNEKRKQLVKDNMLSYVKNQRKLDSFMKNMDEFQVNIQEMKDHFTKGTNILNAKIQLIKNLQYTI